MLKLSNYCLCLKSEVRNRYIQKISLIGNYDPYYDNDISEENWTIWPDSKNPPSIIPPIQYIDIVDYFIHKKSAYTSEEFKNPKSVDAINFFVSGHIKRASWRQMEEYFLVRARVDHSQSLNKDQLNVWLIIAQNGEIKTGHCTCVAGLGESCSHMAATCFLLENLYMIESKKSCTDVKAYWAQPGKSSCSPKKVASIAYTHISHPSKNICSRKCREVDPKGQLPKYVVKKGENMIEFLKEVSSMRPNAAILKVVRPFCTELKETEFKFPLSYQNLYKEEYSNVDLNSLISIGKSLKLNLEDHQIKLIETSTIQQSKCRTWFNYRAGRLTASNIYSVCRVRSSDSNPSLIKRISYPSANSFKTAATQWGCHHEKDGIKKYQDMKRAENFRVEKSGFYVYPDLPFFGASPDAVIFDGNQKGVLEIKCPFCLQGKEIANLTFLNDGTGSLSLQENHTYFYQVQLQLLCTNAQFADFFVWSPTEEPYLERVARSDHIIEEICTKGTHFFFNSILPELLGKYYSNKATSSKAESKEEFYYCVCAGSVNAKKMIVCSKNDCEFVKYHYVCVGITRKIKNWICPFCKNKSKTE